MSFRKIFIHVGLEKTGSSYLQQYIFPKFDGVRVIRGTDTIKKLVWENTTAPLLITHEAFQGAPVFSVATGPKGWQKSRKSRLSILSELWPHASAIVVLRKHGTWLSSQYRQYLRQGGISSWQSFFSLSEDKLVERNALIWKTLVEQLKEYFQGPLLAMNYYGLCNHPDAFIQMITDFIGIPAVRKVESKIVNKSVRNLQAKLMCKFNLFQEGAYDEPKPRVLFKRNSLAWRLKITPRHLIYRANFLSKFGSDVIPESAIDKIDSFYSQDWEWVEKNIGPVGKVID